MADRNSKRARLTPRGLKAIYNGGEFEEDGFVYTLTPAFGSGSKKNRDEEPFRPISTTSLWQRFKKFFSF